MIPPILDPNTCLHHCHGFELFRVNEKPWVVRRFSRRVKGPDGIFRSEKLVEHLELEGEGWPASATAQVARKELRQAWTDWREWNDAMKAT